MEAFWTALAVIGVLAVVVLATACVCFFKVFYSPTRKQSEEYPIPDGEIYEPYRERMIQWIRQKREMPHTSVSIRSFDGLTLRGNYYEYAKGAPLEILLHGYRGSAERDMSGGVARCFALGHSALVVDHRGSGLSDGHVITFGILERRDCRAWVDFVIREIDPEAKIILTGISMGASTVLMAA
ncbi:MAG: alpha/beta hydrolase, partial [Clostridia bacterium]|nr:alpha/beta hydrolase [Clostridia bacterium]